MSSNLDPCPRCCRSVYHNWTPKKCVFFSLTDLLLPRPGNQCPPPLSRQLSSEAVWNPQKQIVEAVKRVTAYSLLLTSPCGWLADPMHDRHLLPRQGEGPSSSVLCI